MCCVLKILIRCRDVVRLLMTHYYTLYLEERKIIVEWAKEGNFTQKVTIKVITKDVPGILADISKVITKGGANIANASCKTTKDQTAVNMFDVMLKNSGQLRNLMRNIESLKGIISVERFKK